MKLWRAWLLALAGAASGCGAARPAETGVDPATAGGAREALAEPAAPKQGVGGISAIGWEKLAGAGFDDTELKRLLALSPLGDVPPDPTNAVADDARAAKLGQSIFFDKRFSRDGSVSCSTCHDPARGWADGEALGTGLAQVERHSQSLWNVGYNRWFFWDGRADQLWNQALQPLEDAREHGTSRLAVLHSVAADEQLSAAYVDLFGPLPELSDGLRFPASARPVPENPEHRDQKAWTAMTAEDRASVNRAFANVGKSIAAFERKIVSRRAPFDVFVEGLIDGDAVKLRSLGATALRGLELFVSDRSHCNLCHSGPNFTDREFHNTRVPPRLGETRYDPGRFEGIAKVQENPFRGTGELSDDPAAAELKLDYLVQGGHTFGEFKTPSLRNVAVSAPYMHQGQFETLRDVLGYYSTLEGSIAVHEHTEKILVPQNFTEAEIGELEAFLLALTDESLDPELTLPPTTLR